MFKNSYRDTLKSVQYHPVRNPVLVLSGHPSANHLVMWLVKVNAINSTYPVDTYVDMIPEFVDFIYSGKTDVSDTDDWIWWYTSPTLSLLLTFFVDFWDRSLISKIFNIDKSPEIDSYCLPNNRRSAHRNFFYDHSYSVIKMSAQPNYFVQLGLNRLKTLMSVKSLITSMYFPCTFHTTIWVFDHWNFF